MVAFYNCCSWEALLLSYDDNVFNMCVHANLITTPKSECKVNLKNSFP